MCSCLAGPGAFLRDTVPVQSALLGLVELLQAAVCLLQLAEQMPSSCQQAGHGCGIWGQLREDVWHGMVVCSCARKAQNCMAPAWCWVLHRPPSMMHRVTSAARALGSGSGGEIFPAAYLNQGICRVLPPVPINQ